MKEMTKYDSMMRGNAPNLNKMIRMRPMNRMMYLGMFSLVNFRFLNFKDNMLMLLTNRMANTIVNMLTIQKLLRKFILLALAGMKAKKRALAGVGKPMKLVACRSSTLNFANRTADNAGTMSAMKGSSSVKAF